MYAGYNLKYSNFGYNLKIKHFVTDNERKYWVRLIKIL